MMKDENVLVTFRVDRKTKEFFQKAMKERNVNLSKGIRVMMKNFLRKHALDSIDNKLDENNAKLWREYLEMTDNDLI